MFGNPEDRTKIIGTIVDSHQHSRVKSFIEQGKKEATLVTGGEALGDQVPSPGPSKGRLILGIVCEADDFYGYETWCYN